MKTIHEYEAADIDLKDPIHGFVLGQLLVFALTFKQANDEEMREHVASFLNGAQKSGISITKAEVPEVFR